MNFYWQFINKFAHIVQPLNDLLRKDTPWQWMKRENDAFEHLKQLATSELILKHANPQLAYQMELMCWITPMEQYYLRNKTQKKDIQ